MGYEPMITENERDRRTAAWLIETYGAEAVAEAETRIAGARKPYPSNIAKVLGATLPESLKRTENAAARQKLAELRRMLDEHLSWDCSMRSTRIFQEAWEASLYDWDMNALPLLILGNQYKIYHIQISW